MFNSIPVGFSEVNGSSWLPEEPVLTIQTAEDFNSLSWTSSRFTDFFRIYWSKDPFDEIDEEGVNEIILSDTGSAFFPGLTPDVLVTYTHEFPASYSLSVLYYRVYAYNKNGGTLSNQVDSYNFRIAIYESIYEKTLEEMTLRFTPELRRQYQDSILWRSFVQSLCSELATCRFEIKEAVKQLNIQKAVTYFLNAWSQLSGIVRQSRVDTLTGEVRPETDVEYRQRLMDSIFWDRISNVALKKTMLLKLGYEVDVIDDGVSPNEFDNSTLGETIYEATHDAVFTPGEMLTFVFIGPNKTATYVSDTGTTLSYSGSSGLSGLLPSSVLGFASAMVTIPSSPPMGDPTGTMDHGEITNAFGTSFTPGNPIRFFNKDYVETAFGKIVSNVDNTIKFTLIDGTPSQYDVMEDTTTLSRSVLVTDVELSSSVNVNSKLLSNVYRIDLGSKLLPDSTLNEIYDYISSFGSIGNVLIEILQDISQEFNDWDATFGSIYYGPIFMAAPPYSSSAIYRAGTPEVGETLWSISSVIYLDNQYTMGDGRLFDHNDTPDDLVILTRIE